MNEPVERSTLANLTVNAVRATSIARREAQVWRELFLQALTMLGQRDRELREAIEALSFDQRELLLDGMHEFGAADRELLLLTLSMLADSDRQLKFARERRYELLDERRQNRPAA